MSAVPLLRGMGRLHLTALTINCVVGAGILGLPSKVYALLGGYALVWWGVAALAVLAVTLSFAEVGSRFAATGGAYLYAREAFGPRAGFVTGWLALVSRLVALASVCNLFVTYVAGFFPELAAGWGRGGLVIGTLAGLGALLAVGIRHTAWVSTAITCLKIGLLAAVVLAGFAAGASVPPLGPVPSAGAFGEASLLMLFAFAGFESAAVPAGEVRDPRRDLPVALVSGLAVVAALYVAVQAVSIAAVPGLAASSTPVADAAREALGPWAGSAVGVGAVGMLLGTLLTQLLGTSRMLFAMAEQGELPVALSAVHPATRTPLVAIVVTGSAGAVATLASSFTGAVAVTVVTRVLTYAVVCAALPTLRRRSGAPPAAFHVPFGEAVAALGVVASATLLWAASARELATGAGLAAAGLGLRAAFGRRA